MKDEKTGQVLGYGKTYTIDPAGLAMILKKDPGSAELIEMVEVEDDLRSKPGVPKYTPITTAAPPPPQSDVTTTSRKATP